MENIESDYKKKSAAEAAAKAKDKENPKAKSVKKGKSGKSSSKARDGSRKKTRASKGKDHSLKQKKRRGAIPSGSENEDSAEGHSENSSDSENEGSNAEENDDNHPANTTMDNIENVVGTADDVFTENLAAVREHELLFGPRSVLGYYAPLVVHFARESQNSNRIVRTFATTCLVQLMCVSSHFCEMNVPLIDDLLTLAESSGDRDVSAMFPNLMVALGDLTVSWPAIVSDLSQRLYSALARDVPLAIKKNALMVLLHLILNGMVKVKGQLSHLALCLEDEDERIAGLTNLFFSELATKDHALANNLSDVLSHLLTCDQPEEVIIRALRKLFGFFSLAPPRERYLESLMDKLGQRFRELTDLKVARCLMVCVSLVPIENNAENKMKRLLESFPHMVDKVNDDVVYKYLSEVLAKAEKSAGATPTILEFKEKLQKARDGVLAIDELNEDSVPRNSQSQLNNVRAEESGTIASRRQSIATSGRRKSIPARAGRARQGRAGAERRASAARTRQRDRPRGRANDNDEMANVYSDDDE